MKTLSNILILIAATGVGAFAQGRGGAPAAINDFYRFNYNSEEMQPIKYPAEPIATQHKITLHGETIEYTAHVGFLPIHQATSGVTEGHLFYIYYSKNGVTDKSKRPVWFLFNGGPGAATVWLHMGAFGPKMVKLEPNGLATPPPYTYVDNPNCLLDTGDLVFIDAMGTGFSRPEQPHFGPDFGGVENDLAAFGEFIRSFLNEYNLWGSPLFVGGESYGTTRAAGLSGYLTDHDIPINGVMLLSAVIAANASAGEQRQLMTLPTEIMTAHYHKKLPPDLQKLSVEQIAPAGAQFRFRRVPGISFRWGAGHGSAAEQGADRFLAAHRFVEELRRRPRHSGAARAVQHGVAARSAPDDVAARFALRGLSTGCRGDQHQLRLQQRQHRELLPDGIRSVYSQ